MKYQECKTLLYTAILIVFVFWALHLLGLRDSVSILSGTETKQYAEIHAFLGILYLLLYMGALVLAPILGIAALLRFLLAFYFEKSGPNKSH